VVHLDDDRFHRLKVPGSVLEHRPRRSPIRFPMSCEPPANAPPALGLDWRGFMSSFWLHLSEGGSGSNGG
jgi:hypothetical protein